MALTGYSRATGKLGGGVRSVSLIRAGAVQNVLSPTREGVLILDGEAWADYHFAEGTALYSTRRLDGITEHTIEMRLEKLTATAFSAATELACLSEGLVALIDTQAGASLVVGWDMARFKGEFPLRVAAITATTGLQPTDPNGVTITLKCAY